MRQVLLVSLALLTNSGAIATERPLISNQQDQKQLHLTIFQDNLVQVNEQRQLHLPVGQVELQLQDVSAQMQAESLLIKPIKSSKGFQIIEQTFSYNLLTPRSLLENYQGRDVKLVKTHPTTGEEESELAKVLSTHKGVVLRTQRHIETGIPGRLIFPDVPAELTTTPTLELLIKNQQSSSQNLALSYLSQGMQWQANYVAELHPNEKQLDLTAWVTVNNNTGTDFHDAGIRLVAGDIQQTRRKISFSARSVATMERDTFAPGVQHDAEISDYHVFTLPHTTSLRDKQQKQLQLFSANNVPVKKSFRLEGQAHYYHAPQPPREQRQQAEIILQLHNTANSRLGTPLPKGNFRVFKSSDQPLLFLGESNIPHTPKQAKLDIHLGHAFDLSAERKQTDFKRIPGAQPHLSQTESSHEIRVLNSSSKEVQLTVNEPIPGDWKIIKSSHPHEKTAANQASWLLKIPANQEVVLSYRVRIRP